MRQLPEKASKATGHTLAPPRRQTATAATTASVAGTGRRCACPCVCVRRCDHGARSPSPPRLALAMPSHHAHHAHAHHHQVRLRPALKAAPNEQTPQRSVAEPCTLPAHPCSLLRVPGAPVSNSPMVAPYGRVLQRHESCLGCRRFFSRALVVCKQPSMFTLTVLFPRRPPASQTT